jgi:hypothetical protein
MTKLLICLGVTVALAVPAGAVVYINFDDMNSGGSQYGVPVGNNYQGLGIIFTQAWASDYWYTQTGQGYTSYPTIVYGEADCGYNDVDAQPVSAYFVIPGTNTAAPTDFVELLAAWSDNGRLATLAGYDVGGNLVASDTQVSDGLSATLLSISAPNIYKIVVSFDTGDDVNGIDDLYFNAPVPEPSGVVLLGLGVLGAGARILRRK